MFKLKRCILGQYYYLKSFQSIDTNKIVEKTILTSN